MERYSLLKINGSLAFPLSGLDNPRISSIRVFLFYIFEERNFKDVFLFPVGVCMSSFPIRNSRDFITIPTRFIFNLMLTAQHYYTCTHIDKLFCKLFSIMANQQEQF